VVNQESLNRIELAACEDEPIHIPGSIQPHGWLLAFTQDGRVTHASANCATITGRPAEESIGLGLARLLPADLAAALTAWSGRPDGGFVASLSHGGRSLRAFAHRAGAARILELEERAAEAEGQTDSLQADILEFARTADGIEDWHDLARLAARTARRASGFDRVLIYRFDSEYNGAVVAEDGNGHLPAYLGLHFPASDIPAQARDLYRRNRLRLIPDAAYQPVPILPDCGPGSAAPLDLRQAALRSVSPYHLRYMRNMGTAASMSASLLVEGQLWGLISCHGAAPHFVTLPVRAAIEFLAQILSGGLAHRAHAERARLMEVAQGHHDRLLAAMAASVPPRPQTLAEEARDLLALTGAAGAAVLSEASCLPAGQTPPEATLRALAAWLHARGERTVFCTESLAGLWPEGEKIQDTASGVLAISISELYPSYVMWFRPEIVRTVDWAGPRAEKSAGAADGLNPRASFALWRERLTGHASPWAPHEIEAARRLRAAIVGVVLRRAEELAGLNRELLRTNKELEAFSYSISHDLRAPFRHIVGYAELLRERLGSNTDDKTGRYLQTIVDSAMSAGQLVDDLLHFSRLGRMAISPGWVDLAKLVQEARKGLELETAGRAIEWRIGGLPPAWGDQSLLRQAVLNLLSNALKYSRGRAPAIIEITGETLAGVTRFAVRDNGVGFDMTYAGKLFGVFQRLHLSEQYEGTGIGLALTRRIIERHGGRIEAQGELDRGACFTFTLPRPERTGAGTIGRTAAADRSADNPEP
jgi:light-regulated signal transduction histidine kinase (bacteriophytochrome)